MKKLCLSLLLLVISTGPVDAKDRVIDNPAYELSTSGITHITKIVLNESETRIHIHTTFIPGWWVKFSKKNFIKDSKSGEKLYATGIIGGEFDKEIAMKASGDSSFVLVFPALDKAISHIDFGEDDKVILFGVSLNPRQKKVQKVIEFPVAAQQWIEAEIAKGKVKTLVDYTSPKFFSRDTARLVGYIKGYDPRLDFYTGMIYSRNDLTGEDSPVIVRVHEDGRFEADIPMVHPEYTYVLFNSQGIRFYIEPGQTLGMVLNWDEFLLADRKRNIRYEFQDVQYKGPAAIINQELLSVSLPQQDYNSLQKSVKNLNPAQFKASQMAIWQKHKDDVEEQIKTKILTAQTQTIMRNEVAMSNAAFMFDYVKNRESEFRRDQANELLKVKPDSSYYDFLQLLPLNDQSLLIASDFSSFINRFEFSTPVTDGKYNRGSSPHKTLIEYLFTDLKLMPSKEDQVYVDFTRELTKKLKAGLTELERQQVMKDYSEHAKVFHKKYQTHLSRYNNLFPSPKPLSATDREIQTWRRIDSVVANYYNLQPNLVYEVAKVRSLKFNFEMMMKKEEAEPFLASFEKGITNPFLLREAKRMYNQSYPLVPLVAYDLPPGKATEIFRKIVDPYKGKMLFIDFWGIYCGPCIASIKANKKTRERYKDSKDLEFIFVTSSEDSPTERYDEFVAEQQLANTHRLSADDYRYLRQLFKFNGIPRYIVVNKQGQIMNDNFQMHNFEYELKQLMAKQ